MLRHKSRDEVINFALLASDSHARIMANRRRKSKHNHEYALDTQMILG
jgi:hypothetical protein